MIYSISDRETVTSAQRDDFFELLCMVDLGQVTDKVLHHRDLAE